LGLRPFCDNDLRFVVVVDDKDFFFYLDVLIVVVVVVVVGNNKGPFIVEYCRAVFGKNKDDDG